jgi:RNA polymerase sigma-70 factor (ECF subfamily)
MEGKSVIDPPLGGGVPLQHQDAQAVLVPQVATYSEHAGHLIEPSNRAYGDDDSDRDLLRRISRADRDAFQQLYYSYHQRLARFLVRVISHHEDREEIINDAFLIVWQQAGAFRGASRVSTWIFGIAYRRALKNIRRSTSWSRATALAFPGGEAVVEDTSAVTEDRQLLEFGLSCLPTEQRLALVLAYCMDYSCEEIAAIAECNVNTVKSRMFQARRKLRTIISAAVSGYSSTRSSTSCPAM